MSHFDPETVRFSYMRRTHASAIFVICLGLPATSHMRKHMALPKLTFKLGCYCYTLTICEPARTGNSSSWLESYYFFMSICTIRGTFQSLPASKTELNVSLINESNGWRWFISDLTHKLTCVGEVGVECPARGKFIKISRQQDRILLWGQQENNMNCLFTVRLWEYVPPVPPLVGWWSRG